MDIFERFKAAATADWNSYVDHAFVRQLGDGTLPQAAFRKYLIQDYLFLIQFARANALAIYKSRTLADMRRAQSSVSAILDTEMDLHVRLCARWGISAEALESSPEHAATIAYTRFVLDHGAAGDLLELNVALAPCVIGYGEIGRALAPVAADHPYTEWINEYGGEGYQQVAANARDYLDDLARRFMPESRFAELAALFAAASRLEADFWQMGLDAA